MEAEGRIYCLIGSTRFENLFRLAESTLTLKGGIVLTPGDYHQSGNHVMISNETKEMIDRVMLKKIDMADIIFVIDPKNYIGEATKRHIEYAESINKKILYFSHFDRKENYIM